MLGLALAIDYSLFMVSRFREALAKGRTVGEAIEVTVSTAGKAVAFSGFAVAAACRGCRVRGPGPALVRHRRRDHRPRLAVLRPDVPARDPRDARAARRAAVDRRARRLGPARPRPAERRGGGRRRAIALGAARARGDASARCSCSVPTLAILLIAGTPFFRLVQGIPDAFVLPGRAPQPRGGGHQLQDDFQPGTTTPIVVLADVAGSPTTEPAIRALSRLR